MPRHYFGIVFSTIKNDDTYVSVKKRLLNEVLYIQSSKGENNQLKEDTNSIEYISIINILCPVVYEWKLRRNRGDGKFCYFVLLDF